MKITPPPTPHRAPTAVGGDLSGSTATPVVTGLQGTPLDTTAPTTGQVLAFNGTSWVPTTSSATPLTTKGDLHGFNTVDARVPVGSNGQVLTADSTDSEGVAWKTPTAGGGAELDYAAFTSNKSITHTTEATSDTVVTGNSVAYDGSTVVNIEFYTPGIICQSTTGAFVSVLLYEDSTLLGIIAQARTPAGAANIYPCFAVFPHRTPSAANHTYTVKALTSTGTGTVQAGTGGTGQNTAGFIRVTRV